MPNISIKPHSIKFIHYGANHFNLNKFKSILETDAKHRYFINRRQGGLWASPIKSNNSWRDYCKRDRWNLENFKKSFVFRLKHTAKVLVINSKQDFLDALEDYPYPSSGEDIYLDFDLIQRDYDAMFLTDKGHYSNYWHPDNRSDMNSWSCESIQIFNPDCIKLAK